MALVLFAIAATGAADLPPKSRSDAANHSSTTPQPSLPQQGQVKEIWMGDVLSDDDTLSYNGYVVEKRHKRVRYDYPAERQSRPSRIDVSFAVLKRRGAILSKFDDNIYSGQGNDTRFGLFSFLHGPTKQILVSQDISRGGTQWVIDLSPRPRIVFDGPSWAVGREGDDMRIIDLDHNGAFEIIVPITDFYEFQDKLPIARIPLPGIIFKYNRRLMKYVPANPVFESYALRETGDLDVGKTIDEFDQRARVLEKLLTFIYVGKQKQAWIFYDRSYKLSDREEFRHRIKAILAKQRVYKFIYNPRSPK
jgi:hypothetical protein